jgi:hypothetical protein
MKFKVGGLVTVAALALLSMSVPAFGQDVSVQFTGGYTDTWSNNSGDFGAGIYSANINGQTWAPGIICDDYNDEITTGETWTASANNVSNVAAMAASGSLSSLLFGGSFTSTGYQNIGWTGYAEVADLVTLMYSFGHNSTITFGGLTITQGEISAAIWTITGGSGVSAGNSNASTIASLISAIENALFGTTNVTSAQNTAAQNYLKGLTNLWILTPVPTGVSGEAQEMWTENLQVAEGGAALSYLFLAGLFCCGALYLRQREQISG